MQTQYLGMQIFFWHRILVTYFYLSRVQKEVVESLEKRIDLSDKNLDMLMENDKKQDESLASLEASLPNLDSKLKALESADEFFQVPGDSFYNYYNK